MSTRYSSVLRRTFSFAKPAPIVLFGLFLATVMAPAVDAASGIVDHGVVSAPLAQESGANPEANLPFLFAVYILTWAGFFGYAFYMSRRQREMRREIDALKQAVRDRENVDQPSS